ncbi:polysaccharide lyase family 8 super-sandwich domain-containing protein [Enterovibrio norvegicus]|uniref:Polysaccharide lyase family 8, C-terminal beta-sandwich domain n=1 Tax=Enterovibrio norvegicus DSM 15893 TaxID=1121869 RepID=A0A1I5XTU1_9GAMM|nr:polysaccharide lyase family 8 super-sandwich domain-containing protein [Enterovibrio norvegicus]SFQ35334.1 Polysaccharide lyase family 8, C-terminal beta-sandwich domain [Enterovibrio norvegicus DSM 15893]
MTKSLLSKITRLSLVFLFLSHLNGCDSGFSVQGTNNGANDVERSVKAVNSKLLIDNWNAFLIGQPYMFETDGFSKLAEGKTANGLKRYEQMVFKENEIFEGVELLDSSGEINPTAVRTTFQYLLFVANAYYIPNNERNFNSLYRNPKVLEKIVSATWELFSSYYTVDSKHVGNWWYWEIGTNKILMDFLTLTYLDLPPALFSKGIEISYAMAPDPKYIFNSAGTTATRVPELSTGANRTDLAQINMLRSVLQGNMTQVQESVNLIASTLKIVDSGDGFYSDGGLVQHIDYPYIGGYGAVLLETVSKVSYVLSNTDKSYDLSPFNFMYDRIFDTFEPFIFKSQLAEGVRGRSPSRGWATSRKETQNIVQSFLRLYPSAPPEYKNKLGRLIKEQLLSPEEQRERYFIDYYANDFVPLAIANEQVLGDTELAPRGPLVGNFLFNSMDRVAHRKSDWMFLVSAHSYRSGNYECINGENLKGYRTGDGMTYIYDSDQEQYFNYWPMLDPLLPVGTTEDISITPEDCTDIETGSSKKQNMRWVGGISTRKQDQVSGGIGSYGMHFFSYDDSVEIKKSWFMLEDMIVALGGGLTSSDYNLTKTAVEFRKIKSSAGNKIYIDGVQHPSGLTPIDYSGNPKSIFLEGDIVSSSRGYVFLGNDKVKFEKKIDQAGNWIEVNTVNEERMSNPYIEYNTVNIDIMHGVGGGVYDKYAYIVIPSISLADFNSKLAVSDKVGVEVLTVSADAHVISLTTAGLVAANIFAEDGYVSDVLEVSAQSAVIFEKKLNKIKVWVSEPTRSQNQISLLFPKESNLVLEPIYQNIVNVEDDHFIVDTSAKDGETIYFELTIDL